LYIILELSQKITVPYPLRDFAHFQENECRMLSRLQSKRLVNTIDASEILANSEHTFRPPFVGNERFVLPPPVAEHGFSALITILRSE
jgi:hypothetical protein